MTSFILSDNEKNDRFANEVHDLKDFFTSKKQFYHINNCQEPLNILSETLKEGYIFLYDNQELLDKYPQGVVTENLILIPVKHFDQMRKGFAHISSYKDQSNKDRTLLKNSLYHWGDFLIKPLIQMLELKLDIHIPEEETNSLKTHTLENIRTSSSYELNKNYELNMTALTNQNLLNSIENKDLGIVDFLEHHLASSEVHKTYFKQWLANKTEYLELLPTVASALANTQPKEFTNVNIEDLKNNLTSEQSVVHNLSQIQQLVDEFKKECANDKDLFVKKSSKDLFPILILAEDNTFGLALQYIKQTVFPFGKDNVANSLMIKDFCEELNKSCSHYQRDIMIKVMSDFNLIPKLSFSGDKELIKEFAKELSVSNKPKM